MHIVLKYIKMSYFVYMKEIVEVVWKPRGKTLWRHAIYPILAEFIDEINICNVQRTKL